MQAELALLKEFCDPIYPLKSEEWAAFSSGWAPFSCRRKTVLTTAGETERYLYFVTGGVQRIYHLSAEGREATVIFTYSPSFAGVADSFLTQTTSSYFFESLTSSRFLRLDIRQLQICMQEWEGVRQLILKATAFALKGVLTRQVELLSLSAEEKFRLLLKRSPHVLQIIPHKYLANYLGLDPTTFSKLMSTVRIE
ncbi:MAG: Crp/Fnr family transcriptional regulator [Chitinophagaceae bacterium]|nr:Crp/Fnr family transcriptional regulator [Chitinophagaceae bacterium]